MSRPDEALLQMANENTIRIRDYNASRFTKRREARFLKEDGAMWAAMIRTPAATPAGVAAKLRTSFIDLVHSAGARKHLLGGGSEPDVAVELTPITLIWSAIRDLERMSAADAELVRLGEELLAAWRTEQDAVAATGDDDDITDLCQPVAALIERILGLQARTFAGIGVKAVAYAMIVDRPEESDTLDGRLYRGIHHDACALEQQP